MGCFDYVDIPCPKCGRNVDTQSKAGPCDFETYTLSDMHPSIAADLSDRSLTCKCGATIRFHVQFLITPFVESEIGGYTNDSSETC